LTLSRSPSHIIRMIRSAIICILATVFAFSQTHREFEVASIRPVGDVPPAQINVGLHIDGAQVRITYLSLKDYIGLAYRVRINQIVGPDWLGSQRFDIAAKLPDGGAQSDVPVMLQALLADRFQMKMHRETKEFPVYALEVAKGGLKIMESTSDGDSGAPNTGALNIAAGGNDAGATINFGNGSYFTLGRNGVEAKRLTMGTFADMLTRFLDRPVVDMTGVKGTYDLMLDLSPEDRIAMLIRSAVSAGVVLPPQALALLDGVSNDSLSNSLKKVGLTLEPQKAPLEVLLIDQIQKTPTEN
jgi:uncharacterized protein (TIGR03435 family)